MKKQFDVAIIGGGPAGLSAALTLSRGGRSVCLLDEGKGRNAPAAHMMNFPSRDGTPPEEFKRQIRQDLEKYSEFTPLAERVNSLKRFQDGFLINETIHAEKILLAHGVKDIMPALPGFTELWGKSIFHCPYCHGYEHLHEPIGILASGDFALHYAKLVKGLTQDLILFTNGVDIEVELLHKNGIKVYTEKVEALIHEGEQLTGVKLASGEIIQRRYLFSRPQQKLTSTLGTDLGCELTEHGLYKVDENYMTTQDGIYAAGDIVTPRQSVVVACSTGSTAGAIMNHAILHHRFIS